MKRISIPIIILILVSFSTGCHDRTPAVKLVPEPAEMMIGDGVYRISSRNPVYFSDDDPELENIAAYFAGKIKASSSVSKEIKAARQNPGKGIFLTTDGVEFSDNPEAYQMEVFGSGITINGNSPRAVFWGIQTLLQLLPSEIYGAAGMAVSDSLKLPSGVKKTLDKANGLISGKMLKPKDLIVPKVVIRDEPRYEYRGMHLDVGRHIFPVDFIKKYIDLISMHKMNVFHWHLTEDQGWRIEIKKYPKLTEIGAWRDDQKGGKYGGFYTQKEIREIVAYAKSRYVDVMPEIEMPGHSVAALAAYPELSCTGGPFRVRTAWGVSEDIYCAGKEITFEFLEDVIDEVVELFPFEYFHIGGDEAPKTRWEECPDCQRRIMEEGLQDEHELQSYFISRMEDYLATKNKKLVGWDEILEGGLAPNATVMSWRGEAGGIAAARQNHDVIMTPNSHLYFDYYQGDPKTEPKAIGGYITMEKVYSYEPTPAELDENEQKYILGAQGNVWTEYISTPEKVEYMALPRMCALAEVVWTPYGLRDYEKFLYRMGRHYLRLDAMNVNYRIPPPVAENESFVFMDEKEIILRKSMDETDIRYTTDGSEPDENSRPYTGPLKFDEDAVLKARTFMQSGKSSVSLSILLHKQLPEAGINIDMPVSGLSYSLFNGSFRTVSQMASLKPDDIGEIDGFSFPANITQESYGLIFNGYINIDTAGVYRFNARSDDGSILYVNGRNIVNNDGLHAPQLRSGEIALGEGWHRIRLEYFQAGGGKSLEVYWSGPEFENQEIKKEDLASMRTMLPMIR